MNTIIGLFSPLEETVCQKDKVDGQAIFIDHSFTMEYQRLIYRIITPIDICSCVEGTPLFRTSAIWDTGALTSCISDKMARKIGLQPIDEGVGVTPAGHIDILYYFIDIHISEDVIFKSVKVAGFPLDNHDTDFLIGMDIISKGNLSIRNSKNKTTIQFETTS